MKYLYEILTQTSRAFPDRVALQEVSGNQITYKSLLEKARQLQQILQQNLLGKGHRIGLLSEKKIETVAGIFGVSMTEATYVPMDVEAPNPRNLFILENCQLNALLIEKKLLPTFAAEMTCQYRLVDLPGYEDLVLLDLNKRSRLHQLAFILYTSGSTGHPKGVMITHQNALSFILWANQTFNFSEKDVFASIAPFQFDLSVFDLYVSILNGAQLQLVDAKTARNPRMLAYLIDDRKISVWYSTPTLLKLMLNHGKLERFEHQSLRYVLFAGEVFPIPPLKQIKAVWTQADFYNLYGPTETNVCTFFKIPHNIDEQTSLFPIGKACSFAQLKIVDPENTEEEPESGELWVSGDSVCLGYWQLPEKNATAFVLDEKGRRWYKTGDWVRLAPEGNFCFVGRKDRMVKRRGFRIELAEIEAALHRHPQILAAAVVANVTDGDLKLIAFFQKLQINDPAIDLIELQQFCLDYIPKYMLPDDFIQVEELPQTNTQKVDYQKLLPFKK